MRWRVHHGYGRIRFKAQNKAQYYKVALYLEGQINTHGSKLNQPDSERMTRFLLELGEGWAFVGRQKEILIAGKTRKIDLLFYHIYMRCYVILELKVKPFDPEFAGKLNFYVNAVKVFVEYKMLLAREE